MACPFHKHSRLSQDYYYKFSFLPFVIVIYSHVLIPNRKKKKKKKKKLVTLETAVLFETVVTVVLGLRRIPNLRMEMERCKQLLIKC